MLIYSNQKLKIQKHRKCGKTGDSSRALPPKKTSYAREANCMTKPDPVSWLFCPLCKQDFPHEKPDPYDSNTRFAIPADSSRLSLQRSAPRVLNIEGFST